MLVLGNAAGAQTGAPHEAQARTIYERIIGFRTVEGHGQVPPMAVPVLVIVGRERTATGTVDDSLLIEAESLAEEAMRID